MAKKGEEKNDTLFTDSDFKAIDNVFTLARARVVDEDPKDENSLVELINIKSRLKDKFKKANTNVRNGAGTTTE